MKEKVKAMKEKINGITSHEKVSCIKVNRRGERQPPEWVEIFVNPMSEERFEFDVVILIKFRITKERCVEADIPRD